MGMTTGNCLQGVVHVLLEREATSADNAEAMFVKALASKLDFEVPTAGSGSPAWCITCFLFCSALLTFLSSE